MTTRSMTLETRARGEAVWALLCRTALRGIDWAAEACGAKDVAEHVEQELLLESGVQPPVHAFKAVDWAKLSDMERVLVASELGHRLHTH
jgi:hypothetical protein